MQISVELPRLLDIADPVATPPWPAARTLSPAMVSDALVRQQLEGEPYRARAHQSRPEWHASRIAWLVTHRWEDPISLEFGPDPDMQQLSWLVEDGNHRLYAAAFLQLPSISVSIGGYLRTAETLLEIELSD